VLLLPKVAAGGVAPNGVEIQQVNPADLIVRLEKRAGNKIDVPHGAPLRTNACVAMLFAIKPSPRRLAPVKIAV